MKLFKWRKRIRVRGYAPTVVVMPTAIVNLDHALDIINKESGWIAHGAWLVIWDLQKSAQKGKREEFDRIVAHLINDKMIEEDPKSPSIYRITLKGAVKCANLGYSQDVREAHRKKEIEASHMALQSTLTVLQRRLLLVTFGLLILGAVAAYYYGIEIWKFYCEKP